MTDLRKWAGNQSKWVKLKTGSTVFLQRKKACRVDEWNGKVVFFTQEQNGFDETFSVVTNVSWCLLHSIFSKRQSLSIDAVNLFDGFFFPNETILWSTNNSTRSFTRHNLFEANRHTMSGETVCFFLFFLLTKKNGFTKTFSADANTIWYLPHSMSSKIMANPWA